MTPTETLEKIEDLFRTLRLLSEASLSLQKDIEKVRELLNLLSGKKV